MTSLLFKYRPVAVRKPLCIAERFTARFNIRGENNSTKKQTPAEYCVDLVRKHDHENYLCNLLLPNAIRSTAFAVRAFNVEVARVEERARDSTIGRMRLKFWEDTLEKIYAGDPPQNPVTLELSRVVLRHKLSKHFLKRLINARTEKISASPAFASLESMETYAENTASPVYYLLLEASDVKDVRVDHAASHLGKAHGITNLIRSILHNAERRSVVVPQDIMTRLNISAESVFRGKAGKKLGDAVYEISSRAKQHLDKARSLRKDVPKKAAPIFLPAVAIDSYLERLRRADFDVYDRRIAERNGSLPLKLYWRNLLSLPY